MGMLNRGIADGTTINLYVPVGPSLPTLAKESVLNVFVPNAELIDNPLSISGVMHGPRKSKVVIRGRTQLEIHFQKRFGGFVSRDARKRLPRG